MNQIKFVSMYGSNEFHTPLDYSDPYQDVFEEIPPFALDEKGNILNKSSFPIFKKTGKINVDEKIQQFKDEVNIYKILEKVALTGDDSYLNQRLASFSDIIDLPDNINDMNEYIKKVTNTEGVDKRILQAAVADSLSSEELQKLIDAKVQEALASQSKTEIKEEAAK